MASKLIVLSLIILSMLSSTSFATNWVYLQRQEGTRYGECTEYLDIDSVVKEDDKITYWTIWVLDRKHEFHDIRKILWKKEAPLTIPVRHRNLEKYEYNGADVETRRYLKPMGFYSTSADEVNRALQYAKAAQAEGVAKPDHTVTPTPRWYGTLELTDCNLYWDIHSIVAWPQDHPTTVEIIVKWVWNKEGLEQRKAFLLSQRPHRDGYESLSYTLVNYQFLATQNKMRILSVTDYDTSGERMTLLDGIGWRDIDKGSKDDTARKIALNWINDTDGTGGK